MAGDVTAARPPSRNGRWLPCPGMADNLELPAAGDTAEPFHRHPVVEHPGTVSMAEATERWEVSERTLRRRLTDGDVPGAYKAPAPKGEQWRIPPEALDALGYNRKDAEEDPDVAPPAPTVAATELLEELRAQREAWQELMADKAKELMASEEDRRKAEAARLQAATDLARAEERLVVARGERDALAAEVEALRARRWWQRRR